MRIAALDCGTNSLRVLVADLPEGADGPVVDLARRTEIVRLGQGVDKTGVLAPEALARTGNVLEEYARTIRDLGVPLDPAHVRLVATSATRDARNRGDFVAMVQAALGVDPEVVSGTEEAALSFAGATREMIGAETALVVDVGGGSTELVVGTSDGVQAAYSMNVGGVRLTERHFHDDPPTAEQIAAAVADIDAALAEATAVVPVTEASTVIAVAGSATTLTAVALGLTEYSPLAIHRARIPVEQLEAMVARLCVSSTEEVRAMPAVHPKRADVLTAGGLVLRQVLRVTRAAAYVASEHDILDGIAGSIVRRFEQGRT